MRPATVGDADVLAAAHARAFFDDPLQVWALPDESTRLAVLERMFGLLLRVVYIPRGTTWTDAPRSSAAMWAAPGEWNRVPNPQQIDELASLERDLDAATMRRLGTINTAMHAVHPDGDHWYLQGLGTDPVAQGQGRGSAVLRPVLDRADAEGTPAYLECTKQRNVAFYERHGFEVTGEIRIPDGGPVLWAMWRAPRD